MVIGGPDTRYYAADYLAAGIDYLVVGEGEQTMESLYQWLAVSDGSERPVDIPGLIFADADGSPYATAERAHLPDMSGLPLPARHRIDLEPYLDAWRTAHGASSLNISTQRGCPYSCKWCSRGVYGKSYRRRPAAQVVAELKDLTERYGPDQFWFVDDVFTINHRWMEEFATELQRADLSIRYECITRAERLNEHLIALLKATGCVQVWIGAESGSQKILDAMDRRVSIATVTTAMIQARTAGIRTGTFLMLGYPGETEADILATLDYLKQARPDHYTITLAYPIKGTELFEELADRVSMPDFAEGSDREIRFARTYPDRYYRHALAYLSHAMALETETTRTWLWRASIWLRKVRARTGMVLMRRWSTDVTAS
jgi:anaerobic magnesium-protoporphyrin IX monomethyl ester cyclase